MANLKADLAEYKILLTESEKNKEREARTNANLEDKFT